eukprot:gene5961-4270_t
MKLTYHFRSVNQKQSDVLHQLDAFLKYTLLPLLYHPAKFFPAGGSHASQSSNCYEMYLSFLSDIFCLFVFFSSLCSMESVFARSRAEIGPWCSRSYQSEIRFASSLHEPYLHKSATAMPPSSSWVAATDQSAEKVLTILDGQIDRWRSILGMEPQQRHVRNTTSERKPLESNNARDNLFVEDPLPQPPQQLPSEEHALEQSLLQERQKIEHLEHELSQVVRAYEAALQRAEWAEGVVLQRTSSGASPTAVSSAVRPDDIKEGGMESSVVVRSMPPPTDLPLKNGASVPRGLVSPSPNAAGHSSSSTEGQEGLVAWGSVSGEIKPDGSGSHGPPPQLSTFGVTSADSGRHSSPSNRSIVVVRKKKARKSGVERKSIINSFDNFPTILGSDAPFTLYITYDYYNDEEDEEELEESPEEYDNCAAFSGKEETKDLDGVLDVMHREAADFAALSCLTEAAAIMLLRHFNWNLQTAQEEYFLNQTELLSAVGLSEASAATPCVVSSSSTEECMICGDKDEDGKTVGIGACQHYFCTQCWRDDVKYKMEKGEELFDGRCMSRCQELLGLDALLAVCGYAESDAEGKAILNYAALQYANQSPRFSRCINSPTCPGFVYLPVKHQPAPTVSCGLCNAEFCFICRRTRHEPASCTEVQRWEDQMDHDSASTSCVISTTKGCPKCHRRIEKNKGCLHMTCRNPCCYEFCWNCLGPWENHDNFRCTNPEDMFSDKTVFSEIQKDFLTLFLGYNQNQLKMREETLRIDQMCLRIPDFTAKLASKGIYMTPYSVEHLLQSAKMVIQRARTTLMYSYVKQWFRQEEREKNLLAHRMSSLENVTMKLSSVVLTDSDVAFTSFNKEAENAISAITYDISTTTKKMMEVEIREIVQVLLLLHIESFHFLRIGRVSRCSLHGVTTKSSEHAVYASNAYVWTRESFWDKVSEVDVDGFDGFCCFRADVDVAFSSGDLDVLILLARDVSAAMPGWTSRVSIVPEDPGTESIDAILLQLSEKIEENTEFRDAVLERSGEMECGYEKNLQGRFWFVNGEVRIMPPFVKSILFDKDAKRVQGALNSLFPLRLTPWPEEECLSLELDRWVQDELSPQMRMSSVTVSALLPPAMGAVFKMIPRCIVRECLLHHLLYFPLSVKHEECDSTSPSRKLEISYHYGSRWGDSLNGVVCEDEKSIVNMESQWIKRVEDEVKQTRFENRQVRIVVENLPRYLMHLMHQDSLFRSFRSAMPSGDGGNSRFPEFLGSDEKWNEEALGTLLSVAMTRWKQALAGSIYPSHQYFYASRQLLFHLVQQALNAAQKRLDRTVSSNWEEGFLKFRRYLMLPYPIGFSPSPSSQHAGTAIEKKFKSSATSRRAPNSTFQQFDSIMMEGEESTSSSSSDYRSNSSMSATDESTTEVLEELEGIFFDDLHLSKSDNGLNSRDVDTVAAREVLQNRHFGNTLKIITHIRRKMLISPLYNKRKRSHNQPPLSLSLTFHPRPLPPSSCFFSLSLMGSEKNIMLNFDDYDDFFSDVDGSENLLRETTCTEAVSAFALSTTTAVWCTVQYSIYVWDRKWPSPCFVGNSDFVVRALCITEDHSLFVADETHIAMYYLTIGNNTTGEDTVMERKFGYSYDFGSILHMSASADGSLAAISTGNYLVLVDCNSTPPTKDFLEENESPLIVMDCSEWYGDRGSSLTSFASAERLFVLSPKNHLVSVHPDWDSHVVQLERDGHVITRAHNVICMATSSVRDALLVLGLSDGTIKLLRMDTLDVFRTLDLVTLLEKMVMPSLPSLSSQPWKAAKGVTRKRRPTDSSSGAAVRDQFNYVPGTLFQAFVCDVSIGGKYIIACMPDAVVYVDKNSFVLEEERVFFFDEEVGVGRPPKPHDDDEETTSATICAPNGCWVALNTESSTLQHFIAAQDGAVPIQSQGDADIIHASSPLPQKWLTPMTVPTEEDKNGKAKPVTFGHPIKSTGYMEAPWSVQQKQKKSQSSNRVKQGNKEPVTQLMIPYDSHKLSPMTAANRVLATSGNPHRSAITGAIFSASGDALLSCGTDNAVFSLKYPVAKHNGEGVGLRGHSGAVLSVDANLSLKTTLALTSAADGTIRIWKPGSRETPILTHKVPKVQEVRAARFFYMDKFIVYTNGSNVEMSKFFLDNGGGELDRKRNCSCLSDPLVRLPIDAQNITALDCINHFPSPILVSAGSNKSLTVFDVVSQQALRVIPDAHTRGIHKIAMCTNTRFVQNVSVATEHLFLTAALDNAVNLWDLRQPRSVRQFALHKNSALNTLGLSFAPAGLYFAVGSEDRSVYIYDVSSGGAPLDIVNCNEIPTALAWHPTDPYYCTVNDRKSHRLHDQKCCETCFESTCLKVIFTLNIRYVGISFLISFGLFVLSIIK